MQQTSGEKEHGSAIVGSWTTEASASSSSSLQASQGIEHVQWEWWWQLVHTGCLPDGTVLDSLRLITLQLSLCSTSRACVVRRKLMLRARVGR